jgi:tetratricopeptide (TPR) repeat protein
MRRCCGRPSSSAKINLEKSARILTEMGMHAEAAEVLVERAKLSPRNPMIWNDLGVEYMAAGQPDKATAAFTRAHKVFPEYPLPLYNLGRLAMGRCIEKQAERSSSSDTVRKFANEAVGFLIGSLERDPLLIPAHTLLSTAYEVLGNEVRAGMHRQEALRLEPVTAVKSKALWLAKIPLLKKFGPSAVRPSLPFLSSKDSHTSGNAH